jgi:hypothetical protein
MTPADIRTLRSHANFVQERLDRALQMDTQQRREEFEWAQKQFNTRYPNYRWQEWAEKPISRERT